MKRRYLALPLITAAVLAMPQGIGLESSAETTPGLCAAYTATDAGILSGASYYLESLLSDKRITVAADNNVHQWEALEEDLSQQWRILALPDGYCKIVSIQNPAMVLTVENGDGTDGNNVYVAPDQNDIAQQFRIEIDDGDYYIATRCSDGTRSLDVYEISTENGANICQWEYWGGDGQKFRLAPVGNALTLLRGDLNQDGVINGYDLALLRQGLALGMDEILSGVADLNCSGAADGTDAALLSDYLLGKVSAFPETYYTIPQVTPEPEPDPTPDPTPTETARQMEYLDRGVVAVSTGKEVFVSWRLLATDAQDIGFHVYRVTDDETTQLTSSPLYDGTNFTDTTADLSKDNTYYVTTIENGVEQSTDGTYTLSANATANCITVPIQPGSTIHFVWVGDFNGDGIYDFLVDRYSDDHQKLEAYLNDGTHLWTMDLGYNSENKNSISPSASTIDVGMWDGATVYDIDCDGYAEILLRIADGVTFGDGSVYQNSNPIAQEIAVIDGMTGALETSAPVPDDYIEIGPMACMMEIGYLDSVRPSIVCWLKNRNSDKTFNSLMVAYHYNDAGKFEMEWKYDNSILFDDRTEYKNGYAEAHQIRIADVDFDGKDEVLHMGYALNSDGTLRYHMDEVVHGDRWYVGSFSNDNNGKEMMGYGIQQNNASGLLEYFYNASTGEILWTHYAAEGTADVGRGNVGDIDPNYDGFECWSFQGLYSMDDQKIADSCMYPVLRLWWDGDLLSESYNDGKIEKWDYTYQSTNRLVTTWKVTDCTGSERGAPMFYGDILGDWREEVIMTSSDYSKLVILTTTIPTDQRIYCLAQNPCYRNCMTAKGYYQSHMLDYFLGHNMDPVAPPNIAIIEK